MILTHNFYQIFPPRIRSMKFNRTTFLDSIFCRNCFPCILVHVMIYLFNNFLDCCVKPDQVGGTTQLISDDSVHLMSP